jgi:recombination protein RecA
MIAEAQKKGKLVTYLDVERSYDPIWAKNFGVNTDDLSIVQIDTAEQALDIIIKLCRENVADLIVLDSIQGLTPKGENVAGKGEKEKSVEDDTMALLARKLSQFFRMSTAPVSNAKCAVLLIGQARMDLGSFIKLETLSGGHALMHYSRLILRVRRGQGVDAPVRKFKDENGRTKEQKLGFDLVVHVNKSQVQGCTELSEIHVPFLFDSGIVDMEE